MLCGLYTCREGFKHFPVNLHVYGVMKRLISFNYFQKFCVLVVWAFAVLRWGRRVTTNNCFFFFFFLYILQTECDPVGGEGEEGEGGIA